MVEARLEHPAATGHKIQHLFALCLQIHARNAVHNVRIDDTDLGQQYSQIGMRVRSAIKRLCDSCKVVRRRGKLYIVCKASPKVN